MTPDQMARIHAASFLSDRPWSAVEFEALLADKFVTAHHATEGFALVRTVAGESELLTLAVDPGHQRRGIATALIARWLSGIDGAADTAFLEVAADNTPAIALYRCAGFAKVAIRTAYYMRRNGIPVDALILSRAAPFGLPGQ